jgi:1-acyl-sn-glycerol-3-phosphate acyltransferase
MFDTPEDQNSNFLDNAYWYLFALCSLMVTAYALTRYLERKNPFDYEHRSTRAIVGLIRMFMLTLHTNTQELAIPEDASIIAVGPHRSGADALALSVNMKGRPLRFWATDHFDRIPVVGPFMRTFKTIPVKENASRTAERTGNSDAIESAVKVVNENGRFAVFPQGNICYAGQDSPMIYNGTAMVALRTKKPIVVLRLDGMSSITTGLVPAFIRNSTYYRIFGTLLVPNDVRTTVCYTIDCHLKEPVANLSEKEQLRHINATLYAFFRHIQDLTPLQIEEIKKDINDGTHLQIWDKRDEMNTCQRQLKILRAESKKLEDEDSAKIFSAASLKP